MNSDFELMYWSGTYFVYLVRVWILCKESEYGSGSGFYKYIVPFLHVTYITVYIWTRVFMSVCLSLILKMDVKSSLTIEHFISMSTSEKILVPNSTISTFLYNFHCPITLYIPLTIIRIWAISHRWFSQTGTTDRNSWNCKFQQIEYNWKACVITV